MLKIGSEGTPSEPVLNELALRNFKAFGNERQIVPMSSITLIYGPNSSGKSSILQALLLLKQSAENHRRIAAFEPRGDYVDLAGFETLAHKHRQSSQVELNVKLNQSQGREIGIYLTIGAHSNPSLALPVLSSLVCELTGDAGTELSLSLARAKSNRSDDRQTANFTWGDGRISINSLLQFLPRIIQDKSESPIFDYSTWLAQEQIPHLSQQICKLTDNHGQLPSILETFTFRSLSSLLPNFTTFDESSMSTASNEVRELVRFIDACGATLDDFSGKFSSFLDGISYLGPVLDEPRRIYTTLGGQHPSVGKRGEFTFDIVSSDDRIISDINGWFERCRVPYKLLGFHNITSNELTGALGTIELEDIRTATKVTPVDVGYGISQLLPLIVEAVAGESRVICVDQPEVHLHPKLQAEIADLMVSTADRKQWIVETHSELLALRLQTAIAEGRISSSNVSIVYVDPFESPEFGSVIKEIKLDQQGEFTTRWPDGFFVEGHEELMARLRLIAGIGS